MGWIAIVLILLIIFSYIGYKASKVDWGGRVVNILDGWMRIVCHRVHKLPDIIIPLPKTGGAIVVANHVSGLDPFLLMTASRRPLRFLIAREEYERPVLHWLFKAGGCIPVDRSGRPELALRQALKALKSGEVLAIFPHGKIHLDSDPPRKLKGGVARLSAWTHSNIYPVRIEDIACEGSVALAPFVPSKAKLITAPAVQADKEDLNQCLNDIYQAITK